MKYYLIDKCVIKYHDNDTQQLKRLYKFTDKNAKSISAFTYYLIGLLYYVVSIPAKIFNSIFNMCIKYGDKFSDSVLHDFEE